jgi:CrcB protein
MARLGLSVTVPMLVGGRFPWATLLINVLGSFVIGWFGVVSSPGGRFAGAADMRSFVMIGLCGGFTTFSSFSLQTFELIQGGDTVRACAYVVASVLLCVLGVWLGVGLGRA